MWLGGVLAASTALGLAASGCTSESEDGAVQTDVCISTEEYFADAYFKVFKAKCASCHQIGSVGAEQSDFDLRPSSEAGFLESNLDVLQKIASLESNGTSLLLQKLLGKLDHGGGPVLKETDSEYKVIEGLVQRFQEGDSCPNTQARYLAGIELAGPEENLRKAALVLASRLPTDEEIAQVQKGGWDTHDKIVDQYLEEDAFYSRLKEKYNDLLLTDFYLNDNNFDVIGDDDIYDPRWFEQVPATDANIKKYGARSADEMYDILRARTQRAVAQGSLELIAHVVKENKPFTEILTANYKLVNPYSAKAYKVTDIAFENDADAGEWKESAYYDLVPQAGVLTDPIFLKRHETTDTNRARHRARMVLYVFLANDILKAAERPLDITAVDLKQTPTMNEVTCTVCHTMVDPIAGGFRNFQNDADFAFEPDNQWFTDMFPPGFKGTDMPASKYGEALPWLGQQVANDPGFSFASAFVAFRVVTGQEPLQPPADPTDPMFSSQLNAYLGQYYTISKIASDFRNNGYNFKQMVKDVVKSPYFRAKNTAPGISPIQVPHLDGVGTAHLLTPEQLDRKVRNAFGMPWGREYDWYGGSNLLDGGGDQGYRLLFGGIDSENVTNRIDVPNGIMANVIERMGVEMGCRLVGAEWTLPPEKRRWFAEVGPDMQPEDANGYVIPEAETAIKKQIQGLHERLLGEHLELNDPELMRTYTLFLETWREGKTDIAPVDPGFPWECRPYDGDREQYMNYLTGEYFPPEYADGFGDDPTYTGRAWSAVLAYMLTDYRFVYE